MPVSARARRPERQGRFGAGCCTRKTRLRFEGGIVVDVHALELHGGWDAPLALLNHVPRFVCQVMILAWREVDVFAHDDLKPGDALHGPAIIEAETTTVVINEGDELSVNALGWLDIRVGKGSVS